VIRSTARLLWRAFASFLDHSGPDRAAAVSYYTLLSLLPMLVFLISLGVKVLGSFDAAYEGTLFLLNGMVVHLDKESLDALRSFVGHATRLQWPGLLLLAWTSRRIFGSLFGALEKVFGVPGRSYAKHHLVALASVLVTGVGLLLTMVLTTVLATIDGLLARFADPGSRETFSLLWALGVNALPVAITFSFFFMSYRLVPSQAVSTEHAAAGALIATMLWELAKSGFAYYVRNVARYAGIYGTLEGVIVLALWLELSVSIILYCGEIVALMQPRNPNGTNPPPPSLEPTPSEDEKKAN